MKKAVLIFSGALLLDQVTKFFALHQGWVTPNPGISFGLLERTQTWALPVLSLVVLSILVWQFKGVGKQYTTASAFFFAGALSNIIDRLSVGAVQDWLPIPGLTLHNNLADWYIALSLLYILAQEAKKQYA